MIVALEQKMQRATVCNFTKKDLIEIICVEKKGR